MKSIKNRIEQLKYKFLEFKLGVRNRNSETSMQESDYMDDLINSGKLTEVPKSKIGYTPMEWIKNRKK